jgi:hypothetical protein
MNRLLGAVSTLVVAVAFGQACRDELTPAQRAQWHADSTRYLMEFRRWQHDSAVIDSLVRIAPKDSLLGLYRNMLRSKTPGTYPQLIECEAQRITDRYGPRVGQQVQDGTKQRAFSEVSDSQISAMNSRMPPAVPIEIWGPICGHHVSIAPDSIEGVSLRDSLARPDPPRQPN